MDLGRILPSMLKVEGRIQVLAEPVTVPTNSAGAITLENPRPDALSGFVPLLREQEGGN